MNTIEQCQAEKDRLTAYLKEQSAVHADSLQRVDAAIVRAEAEVVRLKTWRDQLAQSQATDLERMSTHVTTQHAAIDARAEAIRVAAERKPLLQRATEIFTRHPV